MAAQPGTRTAKVNTPATASSASASADVVPPPSSPFGARGQVSQGHRLMCPPPGYKFIPRKEKVCNETGCFECYDIYCERCESKDRRIIELEMRNTDLVKHLTLLQERLFKRDGGGRPGAVGGAAPPSVSQGDSFAYVQSPVLYDPSLQMQYQATTTFHSVQQGAMPGGAGAGVPPGGGVNAGGR
mmetsp:Transcript_86536/g.218188  ORF Transcript_86536/g.218188 Transcript_86536/m.218188 type:complete len:185 (+) Transcript_86536:3-557(+)